MGIESLDRLLTQKIDQGLPCCAIHIAQRGKTLFEGYYGYADKEKTKKVNADSIFRMASMSKLPLYTAMMMLYEQGRICFHDPISKYFPEWSNMKKFQQHPDGTLSIVPCERPITIKDVMTMSCGLPYCNKGMVPPQPTPQSMAEAMKELWDRGYYSLREHIRATSRSVLSFEPGTHWMYGFSSELAAGIVETVMDMPYNDALVEMIFKPLGMDSTRAYYFGDIRQRMVDVFAESPDGTFTPTVIPMDTKHEPGPENEEGCARLFSTARDYNRLMQLLANDGVLDGVRLLGRKTIELMHQNNLNDEQMRDFFDANDGYGYGYGVRTLIDRSRGNASASLGSFGWSGGFGTWCESDPVEHVSIVFMRNLFPALDNDIIHQMRAAAYGCIE